MSETFYNIAQRAKSQRQIIRRSQFSKSVNCGIADTTVKSFTNHSPYGIIVC